MRYSKNIDSIFTEETQNNLLTKNIAVIGCGGNGGYILDFIARLGVNSIYFWDGDNFTYSNINRQIGCNENTLNRNKADVMFEYLIQINPTIGLCHRPWFFGTKESDFKELLQCDMIIMAADNSFNPLLLRDLVKQAIETGIPCIDESLSGLGGQISIVTNKDFSIWDYNTQNWIQQIEIPILEKNKFASQTAYRCALIAAETVNQMVQYFSYNPFAAIDQNLEIDMYHHKYNRFDKYGKI